MRVADLTERNYGRVEDLGTSKIESQDIDPMDIFEFYEDLTSVVLNCHGQQPDGLKKLWYDMEGYLVDHGICIKCGGEIVSNVTYECDNGSYNEKRYCSECGQEY